MENDRAVVNIGLAADMEDLGLRSELPDRDDELPSTQSSTKRFVGRRAAAAATSTAAVDPAKDRITSSSAMVPSATRIRRPPRQINQVPEALLRDEALREAIGLLPRTYKFEIPKTIHNIRTLGSRRVALQMPEGLLMFASTIADILAQFCPSADDVIIMGDVTYGACCVDDYTARALDCDLLIHYGHSCLVPIDVTSIKTLYVFVDIDIDAATSHLIASVQELRREICRERQQDSCSLALVGTIQFNATIQSVRKALESDGLRIVMPQAAPLSRGEILGCTSPRLRVRSAPDSIDSDDDNAVDAVLYIGDGRFHLESIMIQNPELKAYRYDPYARKLTSEKFDHDEMLRTRKQAIRAARLATRWGLILGTLGRQGNPHILSQIETILTRRGVPCISILLSEIQPAKLALMHDIDCWVQAACPRLSIDWGHAFSRPLLTPYEALVALDDRPDWGNGPYPMDYYARDGLGRTKPAATVTASSQTLPTAKMGQDG